jgi:DNA ligase-1
MTFFAELARLSDSLAQESSRLKKRAAIADAIARTHASAPDTPDAGLFAQYLSGLPFAEWDPRKLNAGGALLSRAVKEIAAADDVQLAAAYRRHGDLGAAAHDLLQQHRAAPQAPPPLTLDDLAEAFDAMASARTTATRAALVDGLLRRASPLEAKYLLKLMLGDMRTGVKQSLVEEAIAVAASTPEYPVTPAHVRHAVMLEADLAQAVQRAFAGTLAQAHMRLFHPLGFMLASPVETPQEAVERFTKGDSKPSPQGIVILSEAKDPLHPSPPIQAFLEDKYDGMRAQVHFGDPAQPGRVAIYSRNREDITESYPELGEAFALAGTDIGPTVLDGEILGWDFNNFTENESGDPTITARGLYTEPRHGESNDTAQVPHASRPHRDEWASTISNTPHIGRALPFAVLGQRIGRKRVSNEFRSRVPVIFMAFDLMVERGELVLHLPLRERRNRLEALAESITPHTVAPLELDPQATAAQSTLFSLSSHTDQRTARPRLLLSPARLVESAEDIDRAYFAARARSNEGVMIKAADSAYLPGRRGLAWVKLKRQLATLDVVITGAEYGNGRRAGTLSDYTFAVRRGNHPTPQTDPANPEDPTELLNVGKAYSGVTDAEIAELTAFLKAHTLEDHGHFRTVEPLVVLEVAFNNIMRSDRHASGFALRFPRILRLRPDKPLTEIDTLARVEAIYQSQIDKPAED